MIVGRQLLKEFRNYNKCMLTLIFDPEKDAANTQKHGVSLGNAQSFEWDTALTWPDTRRDYGEQRMAGLGYIGLRLMMVVYVDRPPDKPTQRRIISLRKANKREERFYAET